MKFKTKRKRLGKLEKSPNTFMKNKVRKKVDLSTMSVGDFMNTALDDSEDSEDHSTSDHMGYELYGGEVDLEEEDIADEDEGKEFDGNECIKKEDVISDDNEDDSVDNTDGSLSEEDKGEQNGEEEEEVSVDENISSVNVNENISDENGSDDDDNDSADENSSNISDDSEANIFDSYSHKKSLEKLRETDPEFYKFLEQNDKKLLNFNVSDSEDENIEEEGEASKVHKPVQELEVASDESDFESEEKKDDGHVVTLKMVKSLQEQLQNTGSVRSVKRAVNMFHSALQRVAAPQDEDAEPAQYVVEGGSVFNAVVQMCVLDLQTGFRRSLNLPASGKVHVKLSKCKKWKKVKPLLRMYFTDLLKLLGSVSSSQILAVLLKHLHQLAMFVLYFPKLRRPLMKRLVKLWGSGEEAVRVIAFLCLLKITTNQRQELLEQVLKMMYLTYVSNCKFISPSTLPSVSFMRRSLAEMFALDEAASYQHVFLYVRQLAIHLRNAITIHKKETIQAAYNWQFIESLHLWTVVLGATAHGQHLKPLLYPLVQVIVGTIKLVPTAQYYPLRFHCVQMLIHLSKQTGVFIPILPFLLEVLTGFNFNKPHKKASMKPLDFTCILRLSKSQLQENGFKDAVIEKIYQQILEYLASESHTISFPDLVVPAVIQLKKFVKDCKSPNYSRKMKQVLDKIEENAHFVESERGKVSFALSDTKAIGAWETNVQLKGTPLMTFYESWNKVNLQQMAKRATENDKLGEYNLPTLKKRDKKLTNAQQSDGPIELFPSSDESDDADGLALGSPLRKKKRGQRGGKGRKIRATPIKNVDSVPEGDDDIVQDLRLSDLD